MFRQNVLWRLLFTLLLVAVLVVGGVYLYRIAWSQGYQAAALAAGGTGKTVAPQAPYFGMFPYAPYWPGYGFPFFFNPFGLIAGIFAFFFIFFVIRSLFFIAWGPRHWGRGWRRGYGPYGPYGPWDEGNRPEDQTAGPNKPSGFSA